MVGITAATIIILLSGGSDLQHYLTSVDKSVKKNVVDKDRKKIILQESKDLSKTLKSLNKDINKHVDAILQVHVDFHASENAYDETTAQLVADQAKAADLILDAREVMRAQMTREEWEAVFAKAEE